MRRMTSKVLRHSKREQATTEPTETPAGQLQTLSIDGHVDHSGLKGARLRGRSQGKGHRGPRGRTGAEARTAPQWGGGHPLLLETQCQVLCSQETRDPHIKHRDTDPKVRGRSHRTL